jgi:hypothetical protein
LILLQNRQAVQSLSFAAYHIKITGFLSQNSIGAKQKIKKGLARRIAPYNVL